MAYTTINKSSDYFNTKLYTGNGGTQSITGIGFQPDFTYTKSRTNSESPWIMDSIQGVTKALYTSYKDVQQSISNGVTAWNSDGYAVGSNASWNQNSQDFVSWNWKANGTGSANTAGSLDSTVSVNTTAGFSIVTWTGNGSVETIGHGLGVAPKMIIIKSLSSNTNWQVYHNGITASNKLILDTTDSKLGTNNFANSSPTANVFYVGAGSQVNASGSPFIAYCFAEKTGYSKIGSYTGNGNADGTFVYTGFKPAWVMIKRSSAGENWSLYDNKRLGYNPQSLMLRPNTDDVEGSYATSDSIDFVSNGFKIRTSGTALNDGTYIYMAIGQSLVGTNNVPASAR